jgi:gamma-tubulin complex component 2
MQRRDTPAARAALARRRQRAAAVLGRPQQATDNTNADNKADTQNDNSKPPINEVVKSTDRASPRKPPTGTLRSSPVSRARPGFNQSLRSPKLKVNVSGTSNGVPPPVKEAIQSPPSNPKMAPLAQRAFLAKQKQSASQGGNHTIDGTLATTGLTATTESRTSPDKQRLTPSSYSSRSEMAKLVLQRSNQVSEAATSILRGSSPTSAKAAPSPRSNTQPLETAGRPRIDASKDGNFGVGASQQQYVDDPLAARRSKQTSSPRESIMRKYNTDGTRRDNSKSPSKPVDLRRHRKEDALLANRRRAVVESKYRFSPQHSPTTGDVPPSARTNEQEDDDDDAVDQELVAARRTKMESAQKQPERSTSPLLLAARASPRLSKLTRRGFREDPPSKRKMQEQESNNTKPSPQVTQHSSRTSPRGNVTDSSLDYEQDRRLEASIRKMQISETDRDEGDDPLTASRRKMEQAQAGAQKYVHTKPMTASPRRNTKSPSPRRIITGLPPSGRPPSSPPPRRSMGSPAAMARKSSPPSNFRSSPVDKFYEDQGSPPESPRREMRSSNVPNSRERNRPPPLQITTVERHDVEVARGRNKSPEKVISPSRRGANPLPTTIQLNGRSPAPRTGTQARANSPGVERLSSFLVETSSVAEISTLADIPIQVQQNHRSTQKTSPKKASRAQQGDLDDQGTLDEGKVLHIDSACLISASLVMLRAYCLLATIKAEKDEDGDHFLAEPSGLCLGKDDETLTVTKVISDGSDGIQVLRYGDTVVFHSVSARSNALGARKVGRNGMDVRVELGFFSTTIGPAEKWMILAARSDREVLVGRAALASKPGNKNGTKSAPIRSGDAILLRNCHTGGVMSIDSGGSLVLLTDSYDPNRMSSSEDQSLLGRLQHHDRLIPSNNDTFQLFSASSPPCPPWVTGDADERMFLTGSYLLQPRRNQRSAAFESNLFVGVSQPSGFSNMESSQRVDVNLSPKTKEVILLDEVIGSFLGLEGRHIRLKGIKGHTSSLEHFEFQLFDADGVTFDTGLRNLVDQILPISTSFIRVRNFVAAHYPGYEYGQVMQAFCEGLDGLLQDYVAFVAQIERQYRKAGTKLDSVTMKSVYFQITTSIHSMSILEHATKAVCEKKGGALINALRALDTRVYMGDVVAKKVLGILIEKSSIPFMRMMTAWLQSGILQDPYEEFMVKRSQAHSRSQSAVFDGDAWEGLFTIDEQHVLEGVVSANWTKQKVMTTGKYWNAVQACHIAANQLVKPSDGRQMPALPLNSDSSTIASYIDLMYQNASRALVRLLMEKFQLMESLQTVRRYFLLDQGDFLMHFLDSAELELMKEFEDVSVGRIQHLLSMSIQLTESNKEDCDPLYSQKQGAGNLTPTGLRCRFASKSLVAHLDAMYSGGIADDEPRTPSRHAYGMASKRMKGIEAFVIDFPKIPFPISLVLSEQTMENYKLLFRHLFFAKHVERRLIGVWRDHQALKGLHSLRGLLGPTFLLRQRMLHFLQNLIYYMTFEVIENNWTEMLSSIDSTGDNPKSPSHKEQTVDDILDIHNEFLRRTLEACLLTNRDVVRSLTKIMNTCLLFSDQMKRFMETTKIVSLKLKAFFCRHMYAS